MDISPLLRITSVLCRVNVCLSLLFYLISHYLTTSDFVRFALCKSSLRGSPFPFFKGLEVPPSISPPASQPSQDLPLFHLISIYPEPSLLPRNPLLPSMPPIFAAALCPCKPLLKSFSISFSARFLLVCSTFVLSFLSLPAFYRRIPIPSFVLLSSFGVRKSLLCCLLFPNSFYLSHFLFSFTVSNFLCISFLIVHLS